jgi:hypothetical protein
MEVSYPCGADPSPDAGFFTPIIRKAQPKYHKGASSIPLSTKFVGTICSYIWLAGGCKIVLISLSNPDLVKIFGSYMNMCVYCVFVDIRGGLLRTSPRAYKWDPGITAVPDRLPRTVWPPGALVFHASNSTSPDSVRPVRPVLIHARTDKLGKSMKHARSRGCGNVVDRNECTSFLV